MRLPRATPLEVSPVPRRGRPGGLWTVVAGLLLLRAALAAPPVHRVYAHRMDPREHPGDARRSVRPPDWRLVNGITQFVALRGFDIKNDRIENYREQIEKYTRTYELGDVIWPSYPVIFASNLKEVIEEIQRRKLYLFDIWGYVPGSGPGGYWQQFSPPAGVFGMLESTLGERWLGMDNGEQDGRYLGGYAAAMTPAAAPHLDQYLNFQRHFERLTTDLGNRMATLVSLNFGHYFLKEGVYTLIGAETAQALPNSQVYYAFIRGAGRQYGVPWFGNASVFNRWGYKTYGSEEADHSPRKGTSLSLLKRLLYTHLLYDSMLAGFESGWFDGEKLSPIGRIQQSAQRWIRQHGAPGAMLTPIAVMTDFYSGWSFPRHLYTQNLYRVWGNLPYNEGDYMTDLVLDMLYPGYQDSSYFHDESGFLTPTPYGDSADCLLSDAPGWLLERYPVLVVAGDIEPGAEIRDKLRAYAAGGGRLVLTARNAARLALGSVPATVIPDAEPVPGVRVTGDIDKPLPKPYRLRPEARKTLDAIFRAQALFEAGGGLGLITCRRAPGEYTVGIVNSSWSEKPFQLVSHCGPIESATELKIDTSEQGAVGQFPEGMESTRAGANSERTIAGGDVRVFRVKVRERGVEEIAHVVPPPLPKGRILPLRDVRSAKEALLARPTFAESFDGVMLDWRYLDERERAALEREAAWIRRQKLRVVVDLSSGLNLYPDLRLLDNVAADYTASMRTIGNVIEKMPAAGAADLILTLHRDPENNMTREAARAGFEAAMKEICRMAAGRGITVYLRTGSGKPPRTLADAAGFINRIGAPNLRIAASTAVLIADKSDPAAVRDAAGLIGLWLAAGPGFDAAGKLWSVHEAIAKNPHVFEYLKAVPAPVVFDAVYRNRDEEYLDAKAVRAGM